MLVSLTLTVGGKVLRRHVSLHHDRVSRMFSFRQNLNVYLLFQSVRVACELCRGQSVAKVSKRIAALAWPRTASFKS